MVDLTQDLVRVPSCRFNSCHPHQQQIPAIQRDGGFFVCRFKLFCASKTGSSNKISTFIIRYSHYCKPVWGHVLSEWFSYVFNSLIPADLL